MAVSKAQQASVNKYIKSNYDRINVTLPKGSRDALETHAGTPPGPRRGPWRECQRLCGQGHSRGHGAGQSPPGGPGGGGIEHRGPRYIPGPFPWFFRPLICLLSTYFLPTHCQPITASSRQFFCHTFDLLLAHPYRTAKAPYKYTEMR